MIELMESDGMTLKAPIDTAIRCGYKQTLNELDTATLELAASDPLTELIDVPTSWVRLTDGEDYVGLYRVKSAVHADQENGATVTYELESAECTLLDDMLIGHHELGGTELDTRWVLNYILARQSTARWELGACDFADQYQYNFEDVTLLEAIMSLGEVLVDEYAFVFDASAKPWTIQLRKLGQEATRVLVYGRNVTAIRRTIDGRIVTRLVGRGYGEGDNQLTVSSINGGKDYIDADVETMARYGVRVGLHADLRQTDPATLLARMRAILESGKRPQVSYEATCVDLHMLTGEDWDNAQVGDRVLILDEVLGETVKTRVTGREKTDMEGDPGSVKLTLDSSVRDTAEELNEILDKIGVQELYSQGATNLYSMQISDSCDADHPLEMSFYVPGNVLRINRCLLKWQVEPFRSYAKLAAAGGGSTRTSEEGGGGTVTIPEQTISVGVKYSSEPMSTDGSTVSLTGGPKDYLGAVVKTTDKAGNHSHEFSGSSETYSISHNHSISSGASATGGIYTGYKSIRVTPTGSVDENGEHAHSFDHTHNMPHVHDIQHEHVIPSMQFELEPHHHSVKIPEHTHDIEYGIFTGNRAKTVTVKVDGTEIPAENIGDGKEIDIAKYMAANDDGRVTRSTWHKVAFVPDELTRITANLFFQVFIQSRGAGDY